MIPVVFLQVNSKGTLPSAVRSCRQYSPSNDIYLIHDTCSYVENTISIPFELFRDSMDKLRARFTSIEDFQYLCIGRWLVLNEVAKAHRWDRFFYADSDVLILNNIDSCHAPFSDCDFTLSRGFAGGQSYWSAAALDAFCRWVFDKFPEGSSTMLHDMDLLREFAIVSGLSVGDTYIPQDWTLFDNAVDDDDRVSWDHNHDGKILTFKNGNAFGFHRIFNRLLRFNSLHCWCQWESRMDWILEQLDASKHE